PPRTTLLPYTTLFRSMQVYQQWPNTGTDDEVVTRGEQEWWIETKISAGPYPDTRRVDIDVGPMIDDQRKPLAYTLASLIGKPAADRKSTRLNSSHVSI